MLKAGVAKMVYVTGSFGTKAIATGKEKMVVSNQRCRWQREINIHNREQTKTSNV